MKGRGLFRGALLLAALAMPQPGCSGAVSGDDPGDDNNGGGSGSPTSCSASTSVVATAALRRLTRREYDNTVADLLDNHSAPAAGFVDDARPALFEDNSASPVTDTIASQYADAADKLARTAMTNSRDRIVACAPAAENDDCARNFVRDFGKRAYRRPLTDVEQSRLFDAYRAARDAGDSFSDAVRLVLTAMLQSPYFVNHYEHGDSSEDKDGRVPLTAHERASRLSYFLWGTMPDDSLRQAAEENKLATADEIEEQALRMLDDSRARTGIGSFFDQWLRLAKVESLDRNTEMFPLWGDSLRDAMAKETRTFVDHVMWEGDAKLTTLLTASFSFVNQPLANVYGIAGAGAEMVRTDLDPKERSGLLTQASLLAMSAHYEQTSPVHRGLMVRERFLCQHMPPPPPNVDVAVPIPTPDQTTRQRFDQHRDDPYCAACHKLLDPVGIGFENYDPVGAYRTQENGQDVDARGNLAETEDLDGPFEGAVELAGRLAGSEEVQGCMVSLWLGYSTDTDPADTGCAAEVLRPEFKATGTDMRSLILSVVKSPAFLNRRSPEKSEACE